MPPARHPLRNPLFLRLWVGNLISLLGDQFYLIALPWLILEKTGSGTALGTIMMTAALPRAILMLLGGALADRISPRRVLLATAVSRACLVSAVALLIWSSRLDLWHLYLLAFGFGIADAFAAPAAQSFLPSLVSREELPAANAITQGSSQTVSLAAPGPAGMLIGALGTAWAFLLDGLSFLAIVFALLTLSDPPENPVTTAATSIGQSILQGIDFVRRDLPLRTLMIVAAVLNFCCTGPLAIGIVWMARFHFHAASALGLLMSCEAAGGLAGMLLAARWQQRHRGRLMLQCCAFIGLCIAGIAWTQTLPLLAALLFVVSTAAAYMNLQLVVWFQQRVERALLGRVMSLFMLCAIGLQPLSMALAGILLQWNFTLLFVGSGAMVLAVTLWAACLEGIRSIE